MGKRLAVFGKDIAGLSRNQVVGGVGPFFGFILFGYYLVCVLASLCIMG